MCRPWPSGQFLKSGTGLEEVNRAVPEVDDEIAIERNPATDEREIGDRQLRLAPGRHDLHTGRTDGDRYSIGPRPATAALSTDLDANVMRIPLVFGNPNGPRQPGA